MNKFSNIVFLIFTIILSNSVTQSAKIHLKKILISNKTHQTSTIPNVRYVKLTMASGKDKVFNISQIACFDENNKNVTKGKSVKPSVVSPYGISASVITDGNENARPHPQCLSLTETGGEFVIIDLAVNSNISSCVIYNRSDCCQNRVNGATLSLHDANNNQITGTIVNSQDNKITVTFSNLTKFVKLQMANNGDNIMNLSQIACFNRNGDNVTKGKTVTPNVPSPYGINPNNLTDGTLATRPHPQSYASANNGNDWVSIDLGTPQEIKNCVIYNRSDCCTNRVIGARLSLLNSNNFENSFKIVSTGNASNNLEFDLPPLTTSSLSNANVRFVKLQMANNGDNIMNLSQIACFDSNGVNVTKGKTVTPNVTSPYGINPNNLTDGTLAARPHPQSYASANNGNDWVSIDLGSLQQIDKCVIYNRSDCCNNRVVGAKLSLLGSDNVEISSRIISTGDAAINVNFSTGVRTVKLQMANNGDNIMNLSQIACFDLTGVNVTKGKTVTPNVPSPYGINPNNLTDGTLATRPHPQSYASANNGNDWVSIDLGSSQQISRCEIYNRSDCCKQRVIGAKLMLLNGDTVISNKTIQNGDDKITVNFP